MGILDVVSSLIWEPSIPCLNLHLHHEPMLFLQPSLDSQCLLPKVGDVDLQFGHRQRHKGYLIHDEIVHPIGLVLCQAYV